MGEISEKPTRERMVLVAILVVTIFIAYIDRINVSVLIVDNEFLTTMGIKGQPMQMGMLMSTFLISYGVGNFLLSPIGDHLGPRKAMCIAIALWGISLFLSGLTSAFFLMLACRVMLGLGEGLHYPMQSTFIKNWIPPNERGRANAAWLVGQSVAPAIGMPLFVWMVHTTGWRSSFFFLALIGLIPLFLLWFFAKDTPRESKRINAAELAYIEKGLEKEAEVDAKLGHTSAWENIKLYLFNLQLWVLVIYWCCNNTIWWGMMTWLPSYLKTSRGFSMAEMGFLASLPFILATGVKIVSGCYMDKFGRKAPFLIVCMLCMAAGIYAGAMAESKMASAILIACGIGSISIGTPAAFSVLQQMISKRAVGGATGLMNGVANVVSSFAPVIIGFFITLTGSYFGGLMFLVGAALLGAVMGLILTVKQY